MLAPKVQAQHMYMRKVNAENGPMAHEVYNVFQDSKHYIWFASDGGIWQYDGKNYKSYTTSNGMPDNVAFGFVEDSQHRLWIKSYSNKLAYIANEKVHVLPCSEKLSEITRTRVISSMHVDKNGTIYQAYFRYNNIVKISPPYNQNNIELIPVNPVTTSFLYITGDGGLIAGSTFYSVTKKPAQAITLIKNKTQEIIPFKSLFIDGPRVVCKQMDDGSYLVCFSNILFEYRNGRLKQLASLQNSLLNAIRDKNQNLWLLCSDNGLLFFTKSDTSFQWPVTYLADQFPNSITQDAEGAYWITTMRNGIYYAPHNEVTLLNEKNGLHSGINYSYYDSNARSTYCFHQDNFFEVKARGQVNKKTIVSVKSNSKNNVSEVLEIDEQNLLLVGLCTAIFHKNTGNTNYLTNRNGNCISLTHACMHNDSVYAVNQNVLFSFHPKNNKHIHEYQLPSKTRCIGGFDNNHILLSCENGLYKFNTGSQQYTLVNVLPENTGIAGTVRSPFFKNAVIVAAKSGEIYILDETLSKKQKTITSLSGIAIKQIVTDAHGTVWLATNKGIYCFDNRLKFTSINKLHGFPTDLVNHIAFGNEQVFVSTEEGLVIFPSSKNFYNRFAPDLYATSFMVNGKNKTMLPTHFLKYDENYLKINFQALNFIAGAHTTYHYKISGLDNKWHATANNNIEFAGLQPGNYTLTVFATNTDGVKSRQTISMNFIVAPPYWKTWWFYGLVAVLLISFTFIVFFVRIRQIKKREEEKNELIRKIGLTEMQALRSQMNPHFIFNSMNSIQHYVLNNEPLNANKYLSKFSKLMRNVLEHSRKEQVLLQEELETVRVYLEIESLRFEEKFSWKINVSKDICPEKLFVPPMLIQPFIENAIWHGLMGKKGEQILLVTIYRENEQLCIEVEDNGIGRFESGKKNTAPQSKKSLGMKITRERLDLMENMHNVKAETIIVDKFNEDNTPKGTKAIIKIPLLKP
ncbi:MAG TPA: histidine kinase [Flavobacteriales bacterium]|nr:histidine kinase [Flavobacteriales bacterium]